MAPEFRRLDCELGVSMAEWKPVKGLYLQNTGSGGRDGQIFWRVNLI
jgi:hypothetical protein